MTLGPALFGRVVRETRFYGFLPLIRPSCEPHLRTGRSLGRMHAQSKVLQQRAVKWELRGQASPCVLCTIAWNRLRRSRDKLIRDMLLRRLYYFRLSLSHCNFHSHALFTYPVSERAVAEPSSTDDGRRPSWRTFLQTFRSNSPV